MRLGEFFFGRQESVEEKADKVGFTVESSSSGYTVKGVDADGQQATWNLNADRTAALLDHVHSVNLGEKYLHEHYGPGNTTGDASRDCEIKHEVREYRLQALENETKPGWMKLLGL